MQFKLNNLVSSYNFSHKELIQELKQMNNQPHYTATSQAIAENAIACSQYIIGSIDKHGNFSIAANPAIHVQPISAEDEAQRLALNNAGKTFVVMEFVKGYRAGGLLEF